MRIKTWEKIWKNRTAQSRNKKKPSLICVIRKAIITQQSKTYAIPPAHTEVPFTEKCMNLWLRFVRILPCFYWKWSIIFQCISESSVRFFWILSFSGRGICTVARTGLIFRLGCVVCTVSCAASFMPRSKLRGFWLWESHPASICFTGSSRSSTNHYKNILLRILRCGCRPPVQENTGFHLFHYLQTGTFHPFFFYN